MVGACSQNAHKLFRKNYSFHYKIGDTTIKSWPFCVICVYLCIIDKCAYIYTHTHTKKMPCSINVVFSRTKYRFTASAQSNQVKGQFLWIKGQSQILMTSRTETGKSEATGYSWCDQVTFYPADVWASWAPCMCSFHSCHCSSNTKEILEQ